MHEIVETMTGVAALGAGDPTLIPAFSAAQVGDPRVTPPHWRADTGADGDFLVHLFVDEEPPVSLAAYLHDPRRIERMMVPSGRVLVAGEEAFYGAAPAERYGRELTVPAGEYEVVACQVRAPGDLVDRRFREQATAAQRTAWTWGRALPVVCATATALVLVAGWMLRDRFGFLALVAPVVLLGLCGYGLTRHRASESFVSAQALRQALRRELPDFTVVFHSRRDA